MRSPALTAMILLGFSVAHAKIVKKRGRDGVLTYVYVPDRPKSRRRVRPVLRFRSLVSQAARKYRLPLPLLEAILLTESAGNTRAVSKAGAQGLMQLIPKTQARMGVTDPFDPRENILGGARYLRELADAFDENIVLVIAGYHAGERAVRAAGHRVPDFPQTKQYVNTVLRRYYRLRARAQKKAARRGGGRGRSSR